MVIHIILVTYYSDLYYMKKKVTKKHENQCNH